MESSSAQYRLGIDFGTATTEISFHIKDQLPIYLPIGDGRKETAMQSTVAFLPGNVEKIGLDYAHAKNILNFIHSVKRCFCCPGHNCHQYGNRTGFPFPWCRADGLIHLTDGRTYSPEDIALIIVREALNRAYQIIKQKYIPDLTPEEMLSWPVNMGCGADFNLDQRKKMISIVSRLGFKKYAPTVDNVIEEPVLAGFTFARFDTFDVDSIGRSLIYDFGGGTLDVAIVQIDPVISYPENNRPMRKNRLTVLATAGNNWLGGNDIDAVIFDYFLDQLASETDNDRKSIERDLSKDDRTELMISAKKAKEELSDKEFYEDILFSNQYGPVDINLTRGELNGLLRDREIVKKSLDVSLRAGRLSAVFDQKKQLGTFDIEQIGKLQILDLNNQLDHVILIGGISKIPYIRDRMNECFPGKIVSMVRVPPVEAVSAGASYQKDAEHFSLFHPPYAVCLKYSDSPDLDILFDECQQRDFFSHWHTGFATKHIEYREFFDTRENVQLVFRKGGTHEEPRVINIGRLSMGKWLFELDLDGALSIRDPNGKIKGTYDYPILHTLQREMRKRKEQKRIDSHVDTSIHMKYEG